MYIERNQSQYQQCSEHKQQQTGCIAELFEAQVKQTPNDVAVVFGEQKLTYQELNVQANQLAHHLQNLGVKPEVLVGICLERSSEMVIGLLAILKAGGAYVPLDPAYPAERLAYMLSDSQAEVLLTQSQLVSSFPEYQGDVVCLDTGWETISTESKENPESDVTPDNLAYVIYTSGSTGKPKGVAMSHSCLLNLIEWQLDNTKVLQNAKTLQFAPISFDVSFQEIFSTWCAGGTLVLISEELRRDPVALLHLLAEKKVARLFLPFIALQQLAEVAESFSLVPGSLREVISAGEQLQITPTIANLFQKLPNCTLQNQYGPSESHVVTAYTLTGSPDTWSALPPIGQEIANAEIYILDESLKPIDAGAEGDLYIGGVSLARGYMNRPQLTEEKFILLDGKRVYKTGDLARYLPCGNIQFLGRKDNQVKIRGYRIELGELEVILNQYPEVAEGVVTTKDNRLVAYVVPGEPGSATMATEQVEAWEKVWDEAYSKPSEDWESGFHIGGWYDSYTGKTLAEEQVREWIEGTVSRIRSLQPQRVLEIGCGTGLLLFQIAPHCQHYCGTDIAAEGLRYIEEQIKGSPLAESVSLDHSPADNLAAIEADFFDTLIINGVVQFFPTMDYLVDVIEKMVQKVQSDGKIFIGDVESFPLLEAFHTSVQLCQASDSTSTKILSDRIQEQLAQTKKLNVDPAFFLALKETFPQISHVEIQLKRGRAQNELTRFRYDVVIHVGAKIASEISYSLHLDWQKDELTLSKVRQQLLATESEILIVNRVPNARIWTDIQAINWLNSSACPETVRELKAKIEETGIEPEDWWALESELPYRINLTWSGDGAEGYYNVIFQHQDSNSVVESTVTERTATEVKPWSDYANQPYQGKENRYLIPQLRSFLEDKLPDYMIPSAFVLLDKLPITPSGKIDRRSLPELQISRQLAGAPPLLELPTDRPRPKMLSNQGSHFDFELDRGLTASLNVLSQKSEATLFMILLAGFATLLYRYSGQEDIVVGSPIANRNRSEVESSIGFFVNTLVLRSDLSGNPSFLELLSRVRGCALDAYEHRDVPFEQLVEVLQPERSLSYSPLFQVAFAFQQAQVEQQQWGELTLTPLKLASVTAKFDLTLFIEETESGIEGRLEYNTDLFNATTIARMAGHFQTLLASIVTNPQERIAQLPMLTEAERHQLLVEWNDTATEYPQDKCIHQLFEEQVERTPDAVAVVFENTQITYRELNNRANQLAHYLRSKGVGSDVLVGICVERSLEMIVGLLGILKAGGAYVPLDPSYPTERLAYMLSDARVQVLLTSENLVAELLMSEVSVVCFNRDWGIISHQSEENPFSWSVTSNLAYVIYTSGSMGQAKGVMISHRSVLNLAAGLDQAIYSEEHDSKLRVSLNGSLAFDTSVKQIVQFFGGHTLDIVPQELRFDGSALLSYLARHDIDVLDCTPSQLRILIEAGLLSNSVAAPKYVLVGGEPIDQSTWQELVKAENISFYNLYGPTECTVDATVCYLELSHERPVIGKAIANTQIYILDKELQPVPIGVPGELHIGGFLLARGYFNRPDLSKEKFIPNQFSNFEGDRLYKTGDLARYLSDGNIEFIGRIDNQVKIRGFRIELGEIEAVLSQHPLVQETSVIAREDQPNQKRLVAYVALDEEKETIQKELRSFLKQKLPDYMIPSAFVFLEKLPLTPNGKVDRRALPTPDSSNLTDKTSFVPPRNNLELQLSQIWSEVLGVNPIGVQDNFFELGGHSLLAVRLMAKIQQQLGTSLPLATLFTESTIENQATLLGTTTEIQFNSPLVPMEKSGNLTPFFLIHPVGGNVLCYADLARYLGNDRPIYGLQSPGLSGDSEALTSIKDMAAYYIKAIQTVQPHAPYCLGGWSLGGVIAWEMAQQLNNSGEEVSLLALIDSYAPSAIHSTEQIDETISMKAFAEDLGSLFGTELLISDNDLQSGGWKEQLQQILDLAKQQNILPPEIDIQQMGQILQVFQSNLKAMNDYQPQPYSGRVALFCALDDGLVRGWNNLSVGSLDTYIIPGDHYTIIRGPQVSILATQLDACLSVNHPTLTIKN